MEFGDAALTHPSVPTTEQLNSALDGRYAIDRLIGEGGMATVYLARDVRHNRKVALKVLRYGGTFVPGTVRPMIVAAGPGGLAWSNDDGVTWTTINHNNYWSVAFASPNTGWAVGRDGRITKLSGFPVRP